MLPTAGHNALAVLCLLCIAAGVPATAQPDAASRLLDEGNRYYREGRYREALQHYDRVLKHGYASGALYYNMGNAYYRLDELGQAIRYYEKARQLLPGHPRVQHNLSIAQRQRVDQFSQLPPPLWHQWWTRLVAFTGVYGLFVPGVLFYLGAIALFVHRIRTRTRSPWHRRLRAFSLAGALLLLTGAFGASVERAQHQRGVIVADRAALHEQPRAESPAVLELHEGTVLDVLEAEEQWIAVRLSNGTTGWLSAQTVAEI